MKNAFNHIIISGLIIFVFAILGGLFLPSDNNADMFVTVIALSSASYYLALRQPTISLFHKISFNNIALAIIIGAVLNLPFLSTSIESIGPYKSYNYTDKGLFIILICILLPIVEEIYFRGLLFQIIAIHLGNITSALVTVSLFTLAHIGQEGIILIALSGIAFTWLTYTTRSVVPAILAHSICNWWWFLAALRATGN